MYRTQNIYNQEVNSDFLLRYNNTIGSKFEYSLTGGGSKMLNKYIKDELRADQLLYPGIFSFANAQKSISDFA